MEKHRPKYIKFSLSSWDYKQIYVCKYCGEKIVVKKEKRKKYKVIYITLSLLICAIFSGGLGALQTVGFLNNIVKYIIYILFWLAAGEVLSVVMYLTISFELFSDKQ